MIQHNLRISSLVGSGHPDKYSYVMLLRDLVPFVQFKKCKKHPWRSVTFSKVAGDSP